MVKKGIGVCKFSITNLSNRIYHDLKLKDKLSEEYWNNNSKLISENLSFPSTDIEIQESISETASTSINDWTSITNNSHINENNCKKINVNLSERFQEEISENIVELITKKVRIYPNKAQKVLFKKCFDAHRYFYNKAVAIIRENDLIEDKKEKNLANTFISIRNNVIISNTLLSKEDNNLWLSEVPYATRELAVKNVITARKAAFTNLKNDNITHFKLNFISKKTSNNIFYVNKLALVNGKIFQRRLGKENCILNSKKKDQDYIKQSICDFPITQEKDGRYYACVCIKSADTILDPKTNICALDPGIRTFQTMYSQESIGEFGYNASVTLCKLYRRENKLKSILDTQILNAKKRYKLKKRCCLLRTKIQHIVNDLHWKTADYLTKNFQVILLPIFGSKNMANKKKRKISKLTTRLLLGFSHYQFQQKLIYKAKQRGRQVILCKEHYTTKCCGRCGTLNHKIAGKKVFECDSCNLFMDRDVHAARNILLRCLTIYKNTSINIDGTSSVVG
jgi:putative transposase